MACVKSTGDLLCLLAACVIEKPRGTYKLLSSVYFICRQPMSLLTYLLTYFMVQNII
jgi:hypothetical protein